MLLLVPTEYAKGKTKSDNTTIMYASKFSNSCLHTLSSLLIVITVRTREIVENVKNENTILLLDSKNEKTKATRKKEDKNTITFSLYLL